MTGMLLLLMGLAAIFVGVLLFLAFFGVLGAEPTGVSRSLAAVRGMQVVPPEMHDELDQPFNERVTSPLAERMTALGHRITPAGQAERVRRKLDLAGNPAGWDVDRVLAYKALGLVIGLAVGLALPLLLGWGLAWFVATAVGLAVLGYFTPDLVLNQRAAERTERIRRDLPDALDMLTISVEAGQSFDAALSEVARNTEGPLAGEFFRVLQEMQLGRSRSEAIRDLGERANLPEMKGFAGAMVQADTFGIPIANVLRIQAHELRLKRTQRAEEAAQKVPVKILFPLIFCILPVLLIVVVGPAVISVIQSLTSAH
jgi:tight adherence protein C